MAKRLHSDFEDNYGNTWTFELYDTSYASTSTECDLEATGFQINYSPSDIDRVNTPFLFSKCEVYVMVRTGLVESIVNQIPQTQEQRFFVKILKNSNAFWGGPVMQDLCRYEDLPYPYVFTISATDGIQKLEDITTDISVTTADLIQLFIDALDGTGYHNILSTSDNYFITASNYYESSMYTSTTRTPYRMIKHENYPGMQKTESGGVETNRSHLEILRSVLIASDCTLMMAEGAYMVFQKDQLKESTANFNYYAKNYVGPSSATGVLSEMSSESLTKTVNLTGGEFSFLPAAKSTQVVFDTQLTRMVMNEYQVDLVSSYTGNAVVAATDLKLRVLVDVRVDFEITTPSGVLNPVYLKWGVQIKIGSYYYTNVNGKAQWSTTAGYYYDRKPFTVNTASSSHVATFYVYENFVTTDLPASGSVQVSFDFDVVNSTGTSQSGFTQNDGLATIKISYENDETGLKYLRSNSSSNSSYLIDYGTVLNGDGDSSSLNSVFKIYNGTSWVRSAAWRKGSAGTTYDLLDLMVRRSMVMNVDVRKAWDGGVYDSDYSPVRKLTKGSDEFVFAQGTFSPVMDEWRGKFIEILDSATSTTGSSSSLYSGQELWKRESTGVGIIPNDLSPGLSPDYEKLKVATTTAAVTSGDILTSISINSPSVNVGNIDDIFLLVDPVDGGSQELTLTAALTTSSTSVSFSSVTFSRDFTKGSYIVPTLSALASRLYTLENA